MEINYKNITYKELKNGFSIGEDVYGIVSHEFENRRKALLSNPNLTNYDDEYATFCVADNIVVGRVTLFPTKVKIGDTMTPALSGSSLEVYDAFRKYAIGVDMMLHFTLSNAYNMKLFAGISPMALPIYKKMKYTILAFPRLLLILNSKKILMSYGCGKIISTMLGGIINSLLKIYRVLGMKCIVKTKGQFEVRREDKVPLWVNDISLNDGHKYMEVHDQRWFQWNLDNSFKNNVRDNQSFFCIYCHSEPVGYFMIKERLRPQLQKMKNVLLGTIVEWGVSRTSQLSEIDINLMALKQFSKDIDMIRLATNSNITKKKLKRVGFIHHDDAHIAVKTNNKNVNDISNIEMWRLRYGYADTILS